MVDGGAGHGQLARDDLMDTLSIPIPKARDGRRRISLSYSNLHGSVIRIRRRDALFVLLVRIQYQVTSAKSTPGGTNSRPRVDGTIILNDT